MSQEELRRVVVRQKKEGEVGGNLERLSTNTQVERISNLRQLESLDLGTRDYQEVERVMREKDPTTDRVLTAAEEHVEERWSDVRNSLLLRCGYTFDETSAIETVPLSRMLDEIEALETRAGKSFVYYLKIKAKAWYGAEYTAALQKIVSGRSVDEQIERLLQASKPPYQIERIFFARIDALTKSAYGVREFKEKQRFFKELGHGWGENPQFYDFSSTKEFIRARIASRREEANGAPGMLTRLKEQLMQLFDGE